MGGKEGEAEEGTEGRLERRTAGVSATAKASHSVPP